MAYKFYYFRSACIFKKQSMNKGLMHTIWVLLVSLSISSCATIFGKSKYPVTINSTPNAANITITNKKGDTVFNGTAPAVVTLKSSRGYFKKESYIVRLSAPGYSEKIFPIDFIISDFYFGNILLGGAIGMLIIDPLTGCMWTLPERRNKINGILTPINSNTTSSIEIRELKDISYEVREKLILIQ